LAPSWRSAAHRETRGNLLDHRRGNRGAGRATQEISRNVQQAAQGTQQVSSHIADVQRGAGETGSASPQVLSTAQMLSGETNRLKLEVGKLLNNMRSA
jgi:methyl-accepting chemotaxis protein